MNYYWTLEYIMFTLFLSLYITCGLENMYKEIDITCNSQTDDWLTGCNAQTGRFVAYNSQIGKYAVGNF